ncbi:MAG: branched-chain amino acid transport system permease protein livM [Actinomycetota bacterium]|nr:branched-chain amino acid transport system permease protein livM [Actinomycetota bacterium]
MLALELAAAGLAFGSVAALSGIGLLITYRATGVFNLAHGGFAMFAAYLYFQTAGIWGWPAWLAAPLVLLGAGPALGLAAYYVVFRPLQRRAAAPAESLVATLGVFVLLVGIAAVGWGLQGRRAPALFATRRLSVGGAGVRSDAVVNLAVVAVTLLVLWWLTTRTRIGVQVRAVVADRRLAEMTRVDADRVAALGWAVGAAFAGLTGVLLAPQLSLTPYGLTLVVLETFAIPVIARLSSLPVAVAGALLIGIGQSELAQVHLHSTDWASALQSVQSNLLAVVLLVALLVLPRLHELGGDAGVALSLASRQVRDRSASRRALERAGGAVLLLSPLLYPSDVLRDAQRVPALALVFVSIVVLTGYSGQVSLGHGAYAGLGALFFARFSDSITELPALLCGMLAAGIVGLLTGYPAIRRRGLFLALTTFAVGVMVSRFVFQEPGFTSGIEVRRPSVLGLSLAGDRVFYSFELVCLAIGLLVVHNLRSGRLGRALVAVRDSEDGARALGIDLRSLKVFIFTVSAALAGLGGGLLTQATLAFSPNDFDPVPSSLFWFTAVVVFGADSAAGAVAAAGLIVAVGAVTGAAEAAFVPIGILALLLGRMPGGVAALVRRAPHPTAAAATTMPMPVLSATGRAIRARVLARTQA